LAPNKPRPPSRPPPFTPKRYTSVRQEPRESFGSYSGRSLEVEGSILAGVSPFDLKHWFQSPAAEKATPLLKPSAENVESRHRFYDSPFRSKNF
jgi:hypothetical protein